jgi:hypothetical protein
MMFDTAAATRRARAHLTALELRIQDDPFAGLERRAAHELVDALYRMKQRVREALVAVPDDDAEAAAIEARLRETDRAIDRAVHAWGRATHDRETRLAWARIRVDIVGWDEEALEPDAPPLEPPALPRTRAAVLLVRAFLSDPLLAQLRVANRGAAPLEGLFRHAEDTLEAATTKLHAAFEETVARAERRTPDPTDTDRLHALVRWAEHAFVGTRYLARNRARGAALVVRASENVDPKAADAPARW